MQIPFEQDIPAEPPAGPIASDEPPVADPVTAEAAIAPVEAEIVTGSPTTEPVDPPAVVMPDEEATAPATPVGDVGAAQRRLEMRLYSRMVMNLKLLTGDQRLPTDKEIDLELDRALRAEGVTRVKPQIPEPQAGSDAPGDHADPLPRGSVAVETGPGAIRFDDGTVLPYATDGKGRPYTLTVIDMIGPGKAAEYIARHNQDYDPAQAAAQVAEEHGNDKGALLRFADLMETKIRSDNPVYQAEVDRQVRAIRDHANALEDPASGFRIPPNAAVAQLSYFADQMRNGSLAEPSVSAAPPDDRSALRRYFDTAVQDARISARESRQRLGHGLLQDTPEARAQMASSPGIQAAMLALDALTAPERGFISGLFRPLFPESNDIYLTRAIEANNAEHPWLIDPRHLRTPQENRDLAADVTIAALTAKLPMSGARSGIVVGERMTPLEAAAGSVKHVNPLGSRYNCTNCVMAVDHQLATGRRVTALPMDQALPYAELNRQFNTRLSSWTTRTAIERSLLARGDGTRAVIYGSTKDGLDGHVWNAVVQKGRINYIDGQTGGGGAVNFDYFPNLQFGFLQGGK